MKRTISYIKKELNPLYSQVEVNSFIYIIFNYVMNLSRMEVHTKSEAKLLDFHDKEIRQIVQQLKKYKPIQYVTGQTEFYHSKLIVTPDVLIPRPETEELVEWLVNEIDKNHVANILDIGTGSGCIAISLARKFAQHSVYAADISESALKIARQNAKYNFVNINYFQFDILNWESEQNRYNWLKTIKYQTIVSNPPYVRESEKMFMHKNVLDYEPHTALFVSDENPIIFYERIADFALQHLLENGKLFFEMNEQMAKQLVEMLMNKGFSEIRVKRDFNSKDRMLCCTKKK